MHQSTVCESTAAPPSSASNTYLSIAAKPKRNCNREVLGAAEEDASVGAAGLTGWIRANRVRGHVSLR